MQINFNYEVNHDVLTDISNILSDYDILISKRIKSSNFIQDLPKTFLQDSILKKCRFCNKSYPQVTFQKKAHAIPNFMGNNSLFSKNECDSCNNLFSKYENELANFMLPLNSIYGVKGKAKIPKYKLKGEPIIETLAPNLIEIKEAPSLAMNDENHIKLNIKLPSYVPDYLYRCLIKIGLSILPESKIKEFRKNYDWLIDVKQESKIEQQMIISIYPSNFQSDEIVCSILEKKSICDKRIIDSILFISYSNFVFQTYLPPKYLIEKEQILKGFPYIIPSALDINKNIVREFFLKDLNSKKKKKNDTIKVEITNME
jgi:hypothetical protein